MNAEKITKATDTAISIETTVPQTISNRVVSLTSLKSQQASLTIQLKNITDSIAHLDDQIAQAIKLGVKDSVLGSPLPIK